MCSSKSSGSVLLRRTACHARHCPRRPAARRRGHAGGHPLVDLAPVGRVAARNERRIETSSTDVGDPTVPATVRARTLGRWPATSTCSAAPTGRCTSAAPDAPLARVPAPARHGRGLHAQAVAGRAGLARGVRAHLRGLREGEAGPRAGVGAKRLALIAGDVRGTAGVGQEGLLAPRGLRQRRNRSGSRYASLVPRSATRPPGCRSSLGYSTTGL